MLIQKATRRLLHGLAASFAAGAFVTTVPLCYYADAGAQPASYALGMSHETWMDTGRTPITADDAAAAVLDWCAAEWPAGHEYAGTQRRTTNPTICVFEWSI